MKRLFGGARQEEVDLTFGNLTVRLASGNEDGYLQWPEPKEVVVYHSQ